MGWSLQVRRGATGGIWEENEPNWAGQVIAITSCLEDDDFWETSMQRYGSRGSPGKAQICEEFRVGDTSDQYLPSQIPSLQSSHNRHHNTSHSFLGTGLHEILAGHTVQSSWQLCGMQQELWLPSWTMRMKAASKLLPRTTPFQTSVWKPHKLLS